MNYTIKQTVSINDIKQKFIDWDRDNFSIEALETIMDLLEETSENGVIDLDIVEICCSYTESPLRQFIWDYGLEEAEFTYDDEIEAETVLAYAEDHTWATLLENGNILYLNF